MNTHDLQVYLAAHAGPFLVRLVTAVVVAAAVYVGARIAARLLTRALHERSGRAQTIAPILRGMVILVGTLLAVIMAMAQLGVDVTTVLAGAGIVGLAVGEYNGKLWYVPNGSITTVANSAASSLVCSRTSASRTRPT